MSVLTTEYLATRNVSPARRTAIEALLRELEAWIAPRSVASIAPDDVRRFCQAKVDAGSHPNTVRKWLLMTRALCRWLYTHGAITADTLVGVLDVRAPRGSSPRPQPRPYTNGELCALRVALDERWPRLTRDEAARAIERWHRGTGSYKRMRSHAIRLQLDAIVALAEELGLRRAEIFALSIDAMHPDNARLIVWRNGVDWSGAAREVPYTVCARRAVGEWLEVRSQLGVGHDRPWVQLWAATHVGSPMKRESFESLLRTYIGAGCTFKRLRDTCAVRWINAGLQLEHLRRLLGVDTLDAVLPYAALAGGQIETHMHRAEESRATGAAA